MSLESIGVIVAISGGIISIIGNAVAITWSFAKLSAKLDGWIVIFSRFEDSYKEQKIRTDSHVEALWKKYDALNDKVITLEAKQ